MKKQTLRLASLSLAAALAVPLARAQSPTTFEVPFNFLISDRTFPAGQYSVSSSSGLLTVRDSSGKTIFIGIVKPVSGRRVDPAGQVVFHCYADRCFLSEYWTAARENGSQLVPSRFEMEFAKHGKGTEFALLVQPGGH
jgi:hypothetical protein